MKQSMKKDQSVGFLILLCLTVVLTNIARSDGTCTIQNNIRIATISATCTSKTATCPGLPDICPADAKEEAYQEAVDKADGLAWNESLQPFSGCTARTSCTHGQYCTLKPEPVSSTVSYRCTNVGKPARGACTVTVTREYNCKCEVPMIASIKPEGQVPMGPGESTRLVAITDIPDPLFRWFRNGQLISGATDSVLIVTSTGIYEVLVKASNRSTILMTPPVRVWSGPVLTDWGLIALALLLTGTALWIIRKRQVRVAV